MSKLGKSIKWLCITGAVTASAGASYKYGPDLYRKYFAPTTLAAAEAKANTVRFATVTRGDLRIVIVEDGKLRAIKNHTVFPTLRGQNRISWLAPEGATVKTGDRLVEFDKKPLEERLELRSGDLESFERAVAVAEEAVKIQKATSAAAKKLAETKLRDADVQLKTYENLEGPKKLNEMENAINEARNKHQQAIKALQDVQKKLDDQLFVEESQRKPLEKELENAKAALESTRKIVETAIVQQKVYRRYDYPNMMENKKQAVDNARLDLEKAKVAEVSEVAQKEQELRKTQAQAVRAAREVEDLKKEIAKCTLVSPADGIVVYGDPNNPNRYYYNGETQIRVGMEWYGSNVLMTIPDLSNFEVVIAIGEEYRGKLDMGNRASVTLEAIPGLELKGTLTKIAALARNRIVYDPSSPKVFDGNVVLDKSDTRMVSGMTTRVEIVAEVVPNALQVPVEAVFNDDGIPVCYIRRGDQLERKQVKPGKSNDHMVEIVSGLAEGDQVALAAPPKGTSLLGDPLVPVTSTTQPSTQPASQIASMTPTTRPSRNPSTASPSTRPSVGVLGDPSGAAGATPVRVAPGG